MCVVCAAAVSAAAQDAPLVAQPLTLDQAIQYAADHYPAVRAALERVNASEADVDVARSAYLPRLDSLWQSNRATANNIFGQVLPQSVIPAMSGPVLASASGQSVWGSATGALFSWEPFDFGLRKAAVASAEATVVQARAGESLTRLDVQRSVASAFLDIVAAETGRGRRPGGFRSARRPRPQHPSARREPAPAGRGGLSCRRGAGRRRGRGSSRDNRR